MENDPSKGAGCKIQCAAFKAGGDIHGSILCLLVYIVGCLCEIGGEALLLLLLLHRCKKREEED